MPAPELRALPGPLLHEDVARGFVNQHVVTMELGKGLARWMQANRINEKTCYAAMGQLIGAYVAMVHSEGADPDDYLQAFFDHMSEGFNKTSDTHQLRFAGLQVEYKPK